MAALELHEIESVASPKYKRKHTKCAKAKKVSTERFRIIACILFFFLKQSFCWFCFIFLSGLASLRAQLSPLFCFSYTLSPLTLSLSLASLVPPFSHTRSHKTWCTSYISLCCSNIDRPKSDRIVLFFLLLAFSYCTSKKYNISWCSLSLHLCCWLLAILLRFWFNRFNEVADVIVFVRMRIDTPVDVYMCTLWVRAECDVFIPHKKTSFCHRRKRIFCILVRELTVKCDCGQFI